MSRTGLEVEINLGRDERVSKWVFRFEGHGDIECFRDPCAQVLEDEGVWEMGGESWNEDLSWHHQLRGVKQITISVGDCEFDVEVGRSRRRYLDGNVDVISD